MLLEPYQMHGPPSRRPVSSLAVVVLLCPAGRIIGDTNVKGVVGTEKDVAVEHVKKSVYNKIALRLAQNAGSLRTIFSRSEKIGGGGSRTGTTR
jgi:hypothetical protein